MNYNLLAILNTDRSTDAAGKFRYRTHQQFGFFDYGSIQHSYKTWAKQDLNSDQYKRALFVGFYKYSDDLYRPVYLKPNGWFSDGYYDYSPTFATVTITEKMLRDNGLLWDEEDRRYLVGKVAYLFDWGPKTVGAIAYNRYFRMEIIVKRLTWTLAFSAIGVFISLLYGTALMAAIVTCITWKIVFGTGIGAVTYVANNSGGKKRRKNKWKSFKQKMNNTRRRGRASNAV
jgi:ABC-type sugar transport system permease subunit